MDTLKLGCWNIEWMEKLWPNVVESKFHPDRQQHVAEQINRISADVLCIEEGPGNPDDMQSYVDTFLPSYRLVTRPPGDPWGMEGNQWIYFIVKPDVVVDPYLMPIAEWYEKAPKKWPVHYWGDLHEEAHDHYRLPQVMRFVWQGNEIEVLGAHLKSKINFNSPFVSGTQEWKSAFVEEALKARIKLATEAVNIRHYLNSRFEEEENPAIFLMGDFNDGPGKERIEREFMFFDLISVLQGDVYFSQRFLNHALFDFSQHLRWSSYFKDKTDPARDPHILLDHILFTQPLVNGSLPIQVPPGAGKVEHTIHNRVNAGLSKKRKTSDHRPLTVRLEYC
ncbi:MAG: endonuclease/exonuclease/phosphatase family protein [Candidatus Thiodiazotropha endolucinida]|nr:endonuclease/exonuclease/phosphatase family protein [Candidatus Thiodiazotropha endolucinida]